MLTAKHFSADGREQGTVELPEAAFSAPARPDVVYDALRSYLANQRQGTVATKTRSLVSGGGKKPWRQKGTGRARHGSIRSPIWVGGGTVFGPQPRDFSYQIPRKMRALAVRSVLAERARDGRVYVVDDLSIEGPKTRTVAALFKEMNLSGSKVLLVGARPDLNLHRSVRNIPGAVTIPVQQLNVYALLACDVVVLTKSGLEGLQEARG
jgi:large subunit ribosomal protein L4